MVREKRLQPLVASPDLPAEPLGPTVGNIVEAWGVPTDKAMPVQSAVW